MKMKLFSFAAAVLLIFPLAAQSQSNDSTMVFTSPNPEMLEIHKSNTIHAWGVDIMLSNNGFGLAGFYRRQFDRELSGLISFGIAESKDDNEVEYVDYWGQVIVPGKINRFLLIPLTFGIQQRLFADDIMDSFRPYVNAGVGPTLILSSPFNKEFFTSLKYARSHYTAGGYIGFGAYFGSVEGAIAGLNIRYYWIPVRGGIESMYNEDLSIRKKSEFGGFFITLNLGSAF
jgi:hypothetical protein